MNCWKKLHRRCLVRKVFPPPEIQLTTFSAIFFVAIEELRHKLPKSLARSVGKVLLLSQLFFVLSQRRKERSLTTRDLAKVGNIREWYYRHNLFDSISVEFFLKTTLYKKRLSLKLEFLLRSVNLRKFLEWFTKFWIEINKLQKKEVTWEEGKVQTVLSTPALLLRWQKNWQSFGFFFKKNMLLIYNLLPIN